jgi:enoyl-CoA hydratase/carnithine racemase
MAMACDYRIMAPNYTIGLNETQLVCTTYYDMSTVLKKKPITNTAWVRARLCKLQKRVHSTRIRK